MLFGTASAVRRLAVRGGRRARWSRWCGCVSGLFITLSVATGQAQLADSQQLQRADQLYRQGRQAMFAERWADAHRILSEAWALKQSYDIGALLGQTELNLAMYPEAAEHLAYALRNYPARDPAEPRRRLEQGLALAQARVATFNVQSNVAGATVLVDGREVGLTPLAQPLFLEPGTHRFEASREGYRAVTLNQAAPAGSSTEVSLELTREVGAVPPLASAGSTTSPAELDVGGSASSTSPRDVVLLVGAGLTLVAGGTSAYFALRSSSLRDEEDELREELGGEPGACLAGGSSRCEDLRQSGEDRADAALGSRVALAVATGLGLATATTYLLWKPERSTPRAAVWWTPHGAGVSARASF